VVDLLAPARALSAVRALWVVGFVVGTTTHAVDLVVGGSNVYSDFPLGVRLFWVALTLLDPAVVVLIVLRRRSGIVLGSAVIIADIVVNWTAFAVVGGLSVFGVVSQSLFAVLIVVTARPLWTWFASVEPHSTIVR
jgi:hypothetical protein